MTALVTAGPTVEAIDPVRFISNHSSGLMGFELANELYSRGAVVNLVCGPVSIQLNESGIRRIDVTSAAEMAAQCKRLFPISDIIVMAAAVADYTPSLPSEKKMKKTGAKEMNLILKPTEDILASMGKSKRNNQILVGFALETDNENANAFGKLQNKKLDFIVLNSLKDKGAGFGTNTNKISIITKSGDRKVFGLKTKRQVAIDIIDEIERTLKGK